MGRSNTDELSGISGAVLSDFTGWGHFFVRCYINRNPDQNGSISADRLFPDADSAKHCEGAHAFSSKGSGQHPVYGILFSGNGTSGKAGLSGGGQYGRFWELFFENPIQWKEVFFAVLLLLLADIYKRGCALQQESDETL